MQGLRPKRRRAWNSDAKDWREGRADPRDQSYTVSHTEYCAQVNVSETHHFSFAHRAATPGSFP